MDLFKLLLLKLNILQNEYTEESEALNFKLSRGQEDLLWDD